MAKGAEDPLLREPLIAVDSGCAARRLQFPSLICEVALSPCAEEFDEMGSFTLVAQSLAQPVERGVEAPSALVSKPLGFLGTLLAVQVMGKPGEIGWSRFGLWSLNLRFIRSRGLPGFRKMFLALFC